MVKGRDIIRGFPVANGGPLCRSEKIGILNVVCWIVFVESDNRNMVRNFNGNVLIKCKRRFVLCLFQLRLERINLPPILNDLLLHFREIRLSLGQLREC